MPAIKFNHLTREIELQGSESFIAANFYRIENLRNENSGVKEMIVASETGQEPAAENGSQADLEMAVKRAPVRKYIRKAGVPGQQRVVVAVAEEKPKEISIASLREKFGLSPTKVRGVLRDA